LFVCKEAENRELDEEVDVEDGEEEVNTDDKDENDEEGTAESTQVAKVKSETGQNHTEHKVTPPHPSHTHDLGREVCVQTKVAAHPNATISYHTVLHRVCMAHIPTVDVCTRLNANPNVAIKLIVLVCVLP
jgi:hypothetical protein